MDSNKPSVKPLEGFRTSYIVSIKGDPVSIKRETVFVDLVRHRKSFDDPKRSEGSQAKPAANQSPNTKDSRAKSKNT